MRIDVDIAIFGSGISGLWTYRLLKEKGYQVVLFEEKELGGVQTLASQGMIHGGQRYILQGGLTEHYHSIRNMPKIWNDCFKGEGDIDLRDVKILSKVQHLFSKDNAVSRLIDSFSSEKIKTEVHKLKKDKLPSIFQLSPHIGNDTYEMPEPVIDCKSLIKVLSQDYLNNIIHAKTKKIEKSKDSISNVVLEVIKNDKREEISVKAKCYVFAAGSGNTVFSNELHQQKTTTQSRPLAQIICRTLPHPIYGHYVDSNPRPRFTISAHPSLLEDGYIWYIGGRLAEEAVISSEEEALLKTYKELEKCFPNIKWSETEWGIHKVTRAEPLTKLGRLPIGPEIKKISNSILAWPIKLTFAPLLGTLIEKSIRELGISINKNKVTLIANSPIIGSYPWENFNWISLSKTQIK